MPRLPAKLQRLRIPAAFKQTRTTFALKIATIIAATATIFYADLALIFNDASQNVTTAYILIVPITVALLTYRKRKMLRAVMPLSGNPQPRNMRSSTSLTGTLLAATATLLYWQGSYTYTPLEPHIYAFTPITSHTLALPIFVIGLILILFNLQTLKQLALPIAFLFLLVPPPSETLARALLSSFTLIFTAAILLLSLSEKTSRTHMLHKRALNCNQCSPDPPPNRDNCRACGRIIHPANASIRKTDVTKLAIILLIAGFLITIQSPAFAINKRTTITNNTPSGPQYNATQILPATNQYTITPLSPDPYLESHHQDLLTFAYHCTASNKSLNDVYLGLDMSSSQSGLPSIKSAPRTRILDKASIQIDNNYDSPVQALYFANQSEDVSSITVMLYWYSSPVFMINQTAQQKQVLTQLTILNATNNELHEDKQQLVDLATQIVRYLLPRETLPRATAHFISQNGILLSAATTIALAATFSYYAAETGRRRKENSAAISKLNSLNMEIVKALRTTKPATIGNLAATLQKNTGQTMTPEELEDRLRDLENAGITRSQISSQNDTPIQTWKT